jgi:hypothetical protein
MKYRGATIDVHPDTDPIKNFVYKLQASNISDPAAEIKPNKVHKRSGTIEKEVTPLMANSSIFAKGYLVSPAARLGLLYAISAVVYPRCANVPRRNKFLS